MACGPFAGTLPGIFEARQEQLSRSTRDVESRQCRQNKASSIHKHLYNEAFRHSAKIDPLLRSSLGIKIDLRIDFDSLSRHMSTRSRVEPFRHRLQIQSYYYWFPPLSD